MVRGIVALLLIGVTLVATPAFAVEGKPYISVSTGITMLADSYLTLPEGTANVDFETGYNIGAALGYDFGPARLETKITFRDNEANRISSQGEKTASDGNFSSLSFMVNGYLDFRNRSIVTPFITAGLGYANVEYENFDDHTGFTYLVGGGGAIALNERVSLDLGYTYFETENTKFDNVKAEYKSHNYNIGWRVSF